MSTSLAALRETAEQRSRDGRLDEALQAYEDLIVTEGMAGDLGSAILDCKKVLELQPCEGKKPRLPGTGPSKG